MTLQDGKQNLHISEDASLPKLFRSMKEVLDQSPKKDKTFIKNELKIKPLMEVCKHSLNDECSPLAIVDFKLMQAAFKHFCEASTSDLQPFSKHSNQWKDSFFISHGDANADVSEECELEKDLKELQMSEISNIISDQEVLDFCKTQFSEKSFSDSLYANVPGELSPLPLLELTPTKKVESGAPFMHNLMADCITSEQNPEEICENHLFENLNLPLINGVVDQKLKISKPVRRKKAVFSKRKKHKKNILLSINNPPKSVLVRNVNSTDSSENCFIMSETQENGLIKREEDLITAEELKQSNLNVQEQQLGSTVSISPKSKVIAKSNCVKSKKKLKKNIKNIVRVKITRPTKYTEAPQEELFKSPQLISKVKNSAIPLQMSEIEGGDKIVNNIIKSPKLVSQAQTLFQSSEQENGKTSKTVNRTVSQSQSPISSSQVLTKDKSLKTALLPLSATLMLEKLVHSPKNILPVKHPVTKSISKGKANKESCDINKDSSTLQDDSIQSNTANSLQNQNSDFTECENDNDSFITNSLIKQSNSNKNIDTGSSFAKDHCSMQEQSVLIPDSQAQKESVKVDKASLDVKSPKQNISEMVGEQSLSPKIDEDVLDYEYDALSDLSDSGCLSPANDNQDGFLGDEEMQSGDGSDGVPNNYDIEVASKTSSDVSSSQANEVIRNDDEHNDAIPRVTRSSKCNSVSEEVVPSSVDGKVDVSKHVDMRLEWDPAKRKSGKKRQAPFSDDEDSDSDSEQSFKRRNNNSSPPQQKYQNIPTEQVPSSSSSKLDEVLDQHFEKFDSVMEHIRFLCANHKIVEAVDITNKYLEISNSRLVRLEIFEEIILGIKGSICSTEDVPEEPLKETFDKLKAFIGSPDAQKRDWRLCSKIIHEYFQHSRLIEFALDLCTFCQTKAIAISNQAIEAYAKYAMSSNAPTPTLLKFLDYVKRVCKLSFPKSLLRHVLERVMRGKECYLLPDFSQLCKLLCRLEAHEVSKQPLQKFMEICVENDCWQQIAHFLVAWAAKGHFPEVLLRVMWSRLDDAGMLFKKLAAEVYGSGEQEAQCTAFFGLIGIILMLESYYKGLLEEENPKNAYILNANDILYTLHKYNINCFDLGESWRNAEFLHKNKSIDPDPATVIFFPYNIIFTAVELCLRLERPKNAFLVFRNYSPKLCEVPTILNQSLKSSVRVKHFSLYLEVTRLLQVSDLDTGLSAFKELISTLEQGTFLDDLKGCIDVNFKAIENIYNDLLVTHMNKFFISNVYDLYQYTHGPCESLLPIKPQVLRGLVVTFAKNQKMDEARTLFTLGCHLKIYQFEKPQPEDLPFQVTISSNMTTHEIKFTIEKYLQSLFPILSSQKRLKTKYEDWFTVKITFKELPCIPPKINCLIVPSVPNTLKRTRSILHLIYSDFNWTENEDQILLSHDTVYNYWYKNYAALQDKSFSVMHSRPLAFGLDSDSATNLSPSETQIYPDKATPSPANHHLPGEVSSTTSDHGHSASRPIGFQDPDNPAKRRISFGSSERSSSHTPESKLSADPESRSLQRGLRSLSSGSVYEPGNDCQNEDFERRRTIINDCQNEALERRRTLSNDMSQLSNFTCKMISPRGDPPLFSPHSPVISHQSPRKSFLVQAQSRDSPFKRSSGTFQSPKQKDASSVSPREISSMQINRGAFQPPKQHVKENISLGNLNFINRISSPKFQSPKQYASENVSPCSSNCIENSDTSANEFINRLKNEKSSLLTSPPKSSFGNANLWMSNEPELPISTVRNLNMSSQGERAFEDFTVKTHSSGRSRLTKPSQSIKVRKIKRSKSIITSQKTHSEDTDKDSNPTTSDKVTIPIQHSSAMPSVRTSPSSSPELSLFTAPPKLIYQRRLPARKKVDPPKLPPYRIPTPCKQLKVIRPVTPIVKSSGFRCITPLSFQHFSRASENHKRPMALVGRATHKKQGMLHKVIPASNPVMKFEKLTVSLQNSSAGRVITSTPSQSSTATSKIINKPTFLRPNVVQSRRNNNVPKNVFEKIITFLKSKVLLKFKNIDANQLLDKATTLANTFVENNDVQRLDSKTMKQLFEFAKNIK